jgi:hypothetical protein
MSSLEIKLSEICIIQTHLNVQFLKLCTDHILYIYTYIINKVTCRSNEPGVFVCIPIMYHVKLIYAQCRYDK